MSSSCLTRRDTGGDSLSLSIDEYNKSTVTVMTFPLSRGQVGARSSVRQVRFNVSRTLLAVCCCCCYCFVAVGEQKCFYLTISDGNPKNGWFNNGVPRTRGGLRRGCGCQGRTNVSLLLADKNGQSNIRHKTRVVKSVFHARAIFPIISRKEKSEFMERIRTDERA